MTTIHKTKISVLVDAKFTGVKGWGVGGPVLRTIKMHAYTTNRTPGKLAECPLVMNFQQQQGREAIHDVHRPMLIRNNRSIEWL